MEHLTRHPERGTTDRAPLDALLDSQWIGTLSTVVDGLPWSVPMLFARDGDRVVLHGSTGAGALRHVSEGAPATDNEEAGAEPDVWSGNIPVTTTYGPAVSAPWARDLPVPASVRRLTGEG